MSGHSHPLSQWALPFLIALLCNVTVATASTHVQLNDEPKAKEVLKAYPRHHLPDSSQNKNLHQIPKADNAKVAPEDAGLLRRLDRSKRYACAISVAHQVGWSNWLEEVETYAPVFRVKSDDELRSIISKSRENSCHVRMMGATHSEDGMVMQRREEDVVIVSLVDHVPADADWAPSLDQETSKVRLTAGMSWYEATQLIRPHGFVFRQRTAGRMFSVGGVIANMVHGGGSKYGFVHDEVTKMLVMISDGSIMEVEGDDLKYWRSSGGQLGIILAVEMEVHPESTPFVTIDPSNFQPIVDESKGGLNMHRKTVDFASSLPAPPTPPTPNDVVTLIQSVALEVFTTVASSDHQEFFYDWYGNTLTAYYTDYSGDRFSGAAGDFPIPETADLYQTSADDLVAAFPDAAFSGGGKTELFGGQDLCDILCVPPTGPPPFGDGTKECVQIPSQLGPQKLLCESPVEVAAFIGTSTIETLNEAWDQSKATINDGYFLVDAPQFATLVLFAPTRAFFNAFLTFWGAQGQAISGALDFFHAPVGILEFRFINPIDTAVLNPVPTVADTKQEFNTNYPFISDAFDTFFPEIPGVPDGIMAIELNSIIGFFDDDIDKWFAFMQYLWQNMPAIPSVQYGENPVPGQAEIVPDCNVVEGVFPCVPSTAVPGTYTEGNQSTSGKCCVPKVPAKVVHFGKGWGYGIDQETTPVTGKLYPFSDSNSIDDMFTTGKQTSINDFNGKIEELDSKVFTGGALQRFLDPSRLNTKFEPRKLVGQTCGSPSFTAEPNAECISGTCGETVQVCQDVNSNKPEEACTIENKCGVP